MVSLSGEKHNAASKDLHGKVKRFNDGCFLCLLFCVQRFSWIINETSEGIHQIALMPWLERHAISTGKEFLDVFFLYRT